jgi:hypothetical protein
MDKKVVRKKGEKQVAEVEIAQKIAGTHLSKKKEHQKNHKS